MKYTRRKGRAIPDPALPLSAGCLRIFTSNFISTPLYYHACHTPKPHWIFYIALLPALLSPLRHVLPSSLSILNSICSAITPRILRRRSWLPPICSRLLRHLAAGEQAVANLGLPYLASRQMELHSAFPFIFFEWLFSEKKEIMLSVAQNFKAYHRFV
jgi:hypothetical protein